MNQTIKTIASIIFIIIVSSVAYLYTKDKTPVAEDNVPVVAEDSILGCYVARTGKDVYTMQIQSQYGNNVSGTLNFKNFEKDSSSGTFNGTYKNGVLLGDYSFNSEGMASVMQVIFKKSGNDFIRGYGDMTLEGTRFADTNKITYDSSSTLAVFKSEPCF